ncbi:unnamed protein product [Gadus morhua 'NCC']
MHRGQGSCTKVASQRGSVRSRHNRSPTADPQLAPELQAAGCKKAFGPAGEVKEGEGEGAEGSVEQCMLGTLSEGDLSAAP